MIRPKSAKPYQFILQHKEQHTHDPTDLLYLKHKHKKKQTAKKNIQTLLIDDFARIVPKHFEHLDQQQLYTETLSMKFKLNKILDDNLKLKTKITLQEKQLDQLRKTGQPANQRTIYTKYYAIEKILDDTRKQCDLLTEENKRIKRSMKYCNVAQLETQKRALYEEIKRLNKILLSYRQIQNVTKIQGNDNYKLRVQVENQSKMGKQMQSKNSELSEELKEAKKQLQAANDKQNKLRRQINSLKARIIEKDKMYSHLTKQIGHQQGQSIKPSSNIFNTLPKQIPKVKAVQESKSQISRYSNQKKVKVQDKQKSFKIVQKPNNTKQVTPNLQQQGKQKQNPNKLIEDHNQPQTIQSIKKSNQVNKRKQQPESLQTKIVNHKLPQSQSPVNVIDENYQYNNDFQDEEQNQKENLKEKQQQIYDLKEFVQDVKEPTQLNISKQIQKQKPSPSVSFNNRPSSARPPSARPQRARINQNSKVFTQKQPQRVQLVIEQQTQRTKLLSGVNPPFEIDEDDSQSFGNVQQQQLSMGYGTQKNHNNLQLSDGHIQI